METPGPSSAVGDCEEDEPAPTTGKKKNGAVRMSWWSYSEKTSVSRGPSLRGVLMAAGSNVCATFQEFLTMLSPPKMAG